MEEKRKERTLRLRAQYQLKDLYITPFRERRRFDEDGNISYVPIESNQRPTGVEVMDDYLRSLTAGKRDVGQFCRHYGLRYADLDSLIFVLTGMRGQDFRMAYQLRLADDLLLYTDLPLDEVAERSGLGTRANLHIAIRRGFGCLAGERRKSRGPMDAGRFRL
jgi:AraC-like DNA-binding protein